MEAVREFNFKEGQSLSPEELLLYALMKTLGNPLVNPKNRNLIGERKAIVKWNASQICKILGNLCSVKYDEEDLDHYLCCMVKLEKVANPTNIGFFDGLPRIDYFAPYVDVFLSKCSYPLIRVINGTSSCMMEVVVVANEVCKSVLDGTVAGLVPAKSLVVQELRLNALHLHLVNFPHWKYELFSDKMILWKPHVTKPSHSEKVILIHEDLTWDVEICGKKAEMHWMEANVSKLSTQGDFSHLLIEVDKAHLCHGIPISENEEVVRMCFKKGVLCHDDSAKASVNGDFIQSEKCHLLANGGNSSPTCHECSINLPQVLKGALQTEQEKETKKNSFELETLNTIAKLNVELRDKKQQVVRLWELYSRLRRQYRELTEEQELTQQAQSQTVFVDKDWVKDHRSVRRATISQLNLEAKAVSYKRKMPAAGEPIKVRMLASSEISGSLNFQAAPPESEGDTSKVVERDSWVDNTDGAEVEVETVEVKAEDVVVMQVEMDDE